MLFQSPDIIKVLAEIVGEILSFLQPIVTPIGEFMVLWINYALMFFPTDNLTIYIIIAVVIVIIGVFVNSYWPGDTPVGDQYIPEKVEPLELDQTDEEMTPKDLREETDLFFKNEEYEGDDF